MKNFFKQSELPPVEDLIGALISANDFLHPEWSKEETIINSLNAVSTISAERNAHKKLAHYVNDVCKNAVNKINEVTELEMQLQLNIDNNN